MDTQHIKIEPSLFAGDFGHLADEAKRIEDAGADAIHFDIMDGHFVPNLSLSPRALAAVNRATDLFLDVHIMVYNPFQYIETLAQCGADQVTFHFEATENVEDTITFIRRCNMKAGLAFRPETSESLIPKYLGKADAILIMTVDPGFGGQELKQEALDKVAFTRNICTQLDLREGGVTPDRDNESDPNHALPPFEIQVDGGINAETAKQCIDAGANNIVAGTYLFSGDMKEKIRGLRA